MTDYTHFNVEDFVHDDFFRRWIKQPDPESSAFFQQWLAAHPEKQAVVAQARTIVEAIDFTDALSPAEKADMWQNIQAGIGQTAEGRVVPLVPAYNPRRKWLWVAASLVGILFLGGAAVWQFTLRDHRVATGYGEIKQVRLPDGSVVTLNANSRLTYPRNWGQQQEREVWLEGEAFFAVTHTADHRRFRVHTPDLDVEVLGTRFNVFKRAGKTKVSLNSGRVRVSIRENGQTEVIMRPGEMVEYAAKQRQYVRKNVNPEKYSSWTSNRLVFDDTPVAEILQNLRDTYGWEVEVKDSAVLAEKLTGEIQTNDEATLVKALAKALETRMTLRERKLTIEKPE